MCMSYRLLGLKQRPLGHKASVLVIASKTFSDFIFVGFSCLYCSMGPAVLV